LRIKVDGQVAYLGNLTLQGSSATVDNLSLTAAKATRNTIGSTNYKLNWEVSFSDGQSWVSAGNSGKHKIYWTYNTPMSPPFEDPTSKDPYPELYDLALEKACGYAEGNTEPTKIVEEINWKISLAINYEPSQTLTDHPLTAYETPEGCLCADHAALLHGLLRSVGLAGDFLFVWAGPDETKMRFYKQRSAPANVLTFQLDRQALEDEGIPANPHFKYHAVVGFGGKFYDPSYGRKDTSIVFKETAMNNTPQQIEYLWPAGSEASGWVCKH
jgi:hypothetical protein